MKLLHRLALALPLWAAAGAHLRLAQPAPGTAAREAGGKESRAQSRASFLQSGASTEESVGSLVARLLAGRGGASLRRIMDRIHRGMSFEDAMERLGGRLPKEVASLVGLARTARARANLTEDSMQKARRILNEMVEASYNQMDDITIECQEFKVSNRKTFDQVVTDLARLGSQIASLDKAVTTSLGCIADRDGSYKQLSDTLQRQRLSYLRVRGDNQLLISLKKNDLAVFDFIMDATKCSQENKTSMLVQLGSAASRPAVNLCSVEDGFELAFADPKVEAKAMSLMTPSARQTLREVLGLAFAAGGAGESLLQVQEAAAEEQLGSARGLCQVDLFENPNFDGWKASYAEGTYPYSAFLAAGAKNDQVSSLRVSANCVAVLYQQPDFTGFAISFPQGSYDMNAMQARGAWNDQASALRVEPDTYLVAKQACESLYGSCSTGQCGLFYYWYRGGGTSCTCDKPAGEYEFIYKNAGYTIVGTDYGGNEASVAGMQLFTRKKLKASCYDLVWQLMPSVLITTTPKPIPTQPPQPVIVKPTVQQWKRCAPVKEGNTTCGLLHDTMSMQWGKFKDDVDKLQAEISKNEDIWKALEGDLNAQLSVITQQKGECSAKFDEATASKNTLVDENKEKGLQYKTLTAEYEQRMATCKAKLEELLYTDVCAVRTVRNSMLQTSVVSPPHLITDCEVGDWVAGECSKQCDDSCPHMVGRDIDPSRCGGTLPLTRSAILTSNEYGIKCPPLTRTSRCAQFKCSVDCVLSQWSGWSKCTKECEGGTQQQTRSPITKPKHGGQACAATVDTRACNTMSCDRDCALAGWSQWSPCSMACNPGGSPGLQERGRAVLVPIRGDGKCPTSTSPGRFEQKRCNQQQCVGDEICVAKQDLIIAMDASGSMQQSGFSILRDFAGNLTKRYQSKYYGAVAVRIGVILFGNGEKRGDSISPATQVLGLTDNLQLVADKVKQTTWQMGFTNMAQAFGLADSMFTSGGRGDAQSAVLVLSDGRYSFAFDTDSAVKKLKDRNTMIYMAPIAEREGEWAAKIKEWASQPWQTNYQLIPGITALENNLDFFAAELVARFCPFAISPSGQSDRDGKAGYMLLRQGGLPDERCATYFDLGWVGRTADCMTKTSADMGLAAFAVSTKMVRGRRCFAQAMKFTKTNYTQWKSSRVSVPCPGGGWEDNALYDTYAIEPLYEDYVGGSGQMPTTKKP